MNMTQNTICIGLNVIRPRLYAIGCRIVNGIPIKEITAIISPITILLKCLDSFSIGFTYNFKFFTK